MKIFGYEYRVSKQSLIDFLGYYGECLTDILEELFKDGGAGDQETEGTNRTGTYLSYFYLTARRKRNHSKTNDIIN